MKSQYEISFEFAHYLWRRKDLGPKPENIRQVAEVLREAGIKILEAKEDIDIIVCEARPMGIREALTGEVRIADYRDYPKEKPGEVLCTLIKKGLIERNKMFS